MKRTYLHSVLLILFTAVLLSGCSMQKQYLPVEHLSYLPSKPLTEITGKVNQMSMPGQVVGYIPQKDEIICNYVPLPQNASLIPMATASKGGLYLVNLKTKKARQIFIENARKSRQAIAVSADAKWVAWIDATYSESGMHCAIRAENLNDGSVFTIFRYAAGYVNDLPQKLQVIGNMVYWINWEQSTGQSEIHAYDLSSRRDRLIARYFTNRGTSVFKEVNNVKNGTVVGQGIIYCTCVDGGYIYFSLCNGDLYDAEQETGDIYRINMRTGHLEHFLSLYHPAYELVAHGSTLIIKTIYHKAINAPNDGPNYSPCLYIYQIGGNKLIKVDTDEEGFFPTISGCYLAWNSDKNSPQLFDMETDTYYTVPGVCPIVSGNRIFWNGNGNIMWASLPGN